MLIYFSLVFALSLPFWLAAPLLAQFAPGKLPANLPVSALMFVCPALVASLLVYRRAGSTGLRQLWERAIDFAHLQPKVWWLGLVGLLPLLVLLEYGLLKLRGVPLPELRLPALAMLAPFALFWIAAVFEELGWQAYAFAPLQARWGTFGAALSIGGVWAVWHIVPYWQAGNSPTWIFWQCCFTVLLRLIIVWFYINTGQSVSGAILLHAMINLSTVIFPEYGLPHDPFYITLVSAVVLGLLIRWKPVFAITTFLHR